MIFVSIGTYKAGFDRLIREIDRLAEKGILKNVTAQTGYTNYTPKFIKYRRFFSSGEMEKLVKKSDFLIMHAGTGTIYNGLKSNKKIIAVPRLKKYNEYFNNHQLELARFMQERGKILAVYDIKDLEKAIASIKKFNPAKDKKYKNKIVETISNFIINKGERLFKNNP
jgi:UDP-N-acetylglucosamine transferase subunit ALG13